MSLSNNFLGDSHLDQTARLSHIVDNTDWLKTAAIIFVVVDHFGHFFMEDDHWWSVIGRWAAPTFFFLVGYAQTRTVPLHWIWLGVILTLLESWNAEWAWVTPNILLSFAFIRNTRPYVRIVLQRHGWVAFAFLLFSLLAVLSIASKIVDYGSEGWLWALFGLCQGIYVDGRSSTDLVPVPSLDSDASARVNAGAMRLLACFAAVIVCVWQEQREYSFSHIQLAVFIFGLGALSASLCLFVRGPARMQPPEALAGIFRFVGRHTLEIYAFQLAGSELLVRWAPDLAP
jgi:hypothetical protein